MGFQQNFQIHALTHAHKAKMHVRTMKHVLATFWANMSAGIFTKF